MSSYTNSSSFSSDNADTKKNLKPNDIKSEHISSSHDEVNFETDRCEDLDTNYLKKSKETIEVVGIHSRQETVKKNIQQNEPSMVQNLKTIDDSRNNGFESTVINTQKEERSNVQNVQDISADTENNIHKTRANIQSVLFQEPKKQQDNINPDIDKGENDYQMQPRLIKSLYNDILSNKNEITEDSNPITASEKKLNELSNSSIFVERELLSEKAEEMTSIKCPAPLPDILNAISKSVPLNPRVLEKEAISKSDSLRKIYFSEKDPSLKSKLATSQTRIMPNLHNSDTLHGETETDLKRLSYLHSLPTNQSIYKLAYDESITDQSEADSRSPSPVDPESQVPKSLTSAEILIHEAESGSEAGSEDVELIPHRYESETFLNENKHVYVNKLSLAVELLRTQESLPYDEEFKRVVGDNSITALRNFQPNGSGKTNFGFVDDSSSLENSIALDTLSNEHGMTSVTEITTEPKHSRQSAIISHSSPEDSCEVAKEAIAQTSDNQGSTDEVRAGYRRFGVQARHYLSPRATMVNPCFCCIVM